MVATLIGTRAPLVSWLGTGALALLLFGGLALASHSDRRCATRRRGCALDEDGLEYEHGWLWRHHISVPRSRIQHTDVTQGPLRAALRPRHARRLHGRHRERLDPDRRPEPRDSAGLPRRAARPRRAAPTLRAGSGRCHLTRRSAPRRRRLATAASADADLRARPARLYGLAGGAAAGAGRARRVAPAPRRRLAGLRGVAAAPGGPLLAFELVQYFTLAYRFDPHDIVIARGLIWKRERHIPYVRVQNIELVQHAGAPPGRRRDGAARHRHRRRCRRRARGAVARRRRRTAGRRPVGRLGEAAAADRRGRRRPDVLVALDVRELLLHGLLTSSGWVVIAAAAGALWQIDLDGWGLRRYLPSTKACGAALRAPRRSLALEIAVLLLCGGVYLPAPVGGVVGPQALRVHADGARRRAVPELRAADAGRPHHPAGAHPEADDVGRGADAAARPRATITVDTAASVAERHTQRRRTAATCWCRSWRRRVVAALIRDIHPLGAGPAPDLDALDGTASHPRAFRRLLRVRLGFVALAGAAGSGRRTRWAIAVGLAVAAALVLLQRGSTTRFTAFAWAGDTLSSAARRDAPHSPSSAPRGCRSSPAAVAVRSALGHGPRPRRHGRRLERRPPRRRPLLAYDVATRSTHGCARRRALARAKRAYSGALRTNFQGTKGPTTKQSSWESSGHGLPRLPIAEDGVEHGQQLVHGGDRATLRRLPAATRRS